MTEAAPAALGCAAHSGWAVVVACSLEGDRPQVLLRERIELIDPLDPASKQPYHTVEGVAVEDAARILAGYAATAERMAGEALRGIAERLAGCGRRCIALGVLESSGRKGGNLAGILASHALIHTADGDHYRNALAAAATRLRLRVIRVRARDLEARSAETLGEPVDQTQAALNEEGRRLGPPWGADQKAAALLARLLLAGGSQGGASAAGASRRPGPSARRR